MGKKILLADDSITIQKVIELTFSDEDFEVVTVGNGRLAIERVQEVRPDFVLCDIIMPEKDGYEVCDFIKKNPALSHIPVLLLTGAFEPFDQDKANRVGANGFLAKPFEPQSLIKRVKDLLAQASRPAPLPSPAPPPVAAPPPLPPVAPIEPPPPPVFKPPPAAAPPAPVEEAFVAEEAALAEEAPAAVEAAPALATEAEEPPMEAAPAPPAAAEESVFEEVPGEWAPPTAEVPLEMRAQAGREAALPKAPVFDEVFDEAPTEPAGVEIEPQTEPAGFETEPPAPAAALASEEPAFGPEALPDSVEVPVFEPEPAPAPTPMVTAAPAPAPAEASFADLGGGEEEKAPAAAPSGAAEVAVPVDMVEKIAQRVVAQVSEKVVREIAWEVIPELAEALIKKEIERLRAELEKL